jgi:hypothetical protein
MANDFLVNESVSAKTDLSYDIFIYVSPQTGDIKSILSFGPFGESEYDAEAGRWATLGTEDTWRVRDLQRSNRRYKIDWDNDNDFDDEMRIITLQKYSDGSLTEEYLKENTILANEVPS